MAKASLPMWISIAFGAWLKEGGGSLVSEKEKGLNTALRNKILKNDTLCQTDDIIFGILKQKLYFCYF